MLSRIIASARNRAGLQGAVINRAAGALGCLGAAVLFVGAAPASAQSTTIDFNTTFGNRLDGTYSEGGYTTSTYAGDVIYAGAWPGGESFVRSSDAIPGTAGQVLSDPRGNIIGVHTAIAPYTGATYMVFDDLTFGGGILDVRADSGSLFTFDSVDFNWFTYSLVPINSGEVTLAAYLNGAEQGTVSFTTPYNQGAGFNMFTGYANGQMSRYGSDPYTSPYAVGSLDLIAMDELRITLPAAYHNGFPGEFELADNLVLSSHNSALPEPATWAMMLLGFGVIGLGSRRRRDARRPLQLA